MYSPHGSGGTSTAPTRRPPGPPGPPELLPAEQESDDLSIGAASASAAGTHHRSALPSSQPDSMDMDVDLDSVDMDVDMGVDWPWAGARAPAVARSPSPSPSRGRVVPTAPTARRNPRGRRTTAARHLHRDAPLPAAPPARARTRTPLERMATLAEMADVVDMARDAAGNEFRREVVPHAPPAPPPPPAPGGGGGGSASERDCLLCNIGSRQYDTSSSTGSLLFATLVKMVDANLGSRGPEAVVGLAVRFYQRWIEPAFAKAGLPCPPLSIVAVRRHVTSCSHSINPRLALNVMLRKLFTNLEVLAQRQDRALEENDMETYVNLLKAENIVMGRILDMYARDVTKMAFNAPVDGDLRPDMVAPFAPWMRTAIGGGGPRGDIGPVDDMPSVYRDWMADYFAGRDTDSAVAVVVANAPLPPPLAAPAPPAPPAAPAAVPPPPRAPLNPEIMTW